MKEIHHYATSRGLRIGRAVEELVKRGLEPRPVAGHKGPGGWIIFDLPAGSPELTTERVLEIERQMEDEEDERKWSPSST